ncbi:MAG: hypothetical protein AAB283_03775 [Planctomycetota bacterium]
MRKLLFILTLIAALGLSSLGLAADCPLEGTPQCPQIPPCYQQ